MSGEWGFSALPDRRTEVRLVHNFTPVDDHPDQVSRIRQALDRNSDAELAALARVAGLGVPADQVVFSFEDVVEVPGSAADTYEFIRRGELWPQRLPHVERAEVTEFPGGVQRLEMTTVTADGSRHDTRSIRIGVPGEWMAYKQEVTPALLTGHSGLWSFADSSAGPQATARVTARHTVAVDPAAVPRVLGPGRTLADAREQVRDALGRNSRATLAEAAAHVRPLG
jgi:aromatase